MLLFTIVTGVVFFLIGIGKGGLGGTLSAVAVPVMALIMAPGAAIGFVLPVLIIADWFSLYFYWKEWSWKIILLMLPGALIGITAGTFLIANAPTKLLQIILGSVVLIFGLYKLFLEGRFVKPQDYENKNWHGVTAGTVAGFASSLAAAGSPPVVVYLLFRDDLAPRIFLGTMVLFFSILNIVKIPYYIAIDIFDFTLLYRMLWLLPLVPLGVWFGQWVVKRINKDTFEKIIVVVLIILALLLIWQGAKP